MEKAKCKNCTDEMIEEMAEIMTNCIGCREYLSCISKCGTFNNNKIQAIRLAYQDYRKIPEGSVVLDRQEYQKYCAYKIIEPQIRGCLDRERELEKQVAELEEQRDRQAYIAEDLIQEKHRWTEQARKETAKEILQSLLDFVNCEKINQGHSFEKIKETLIKVAKTYEVEVEE